MTNPSNAVGTNAAYNGRTSVNAVNDVLAAFSGRGVMSGWAVSPESGLTIKLGGIEGVRDAAIAEDDNGNRTTINNISQLPVEVTLAEADENAARIDAIVAYVNNPAQVETTNRTVDNPQTCGLIAVTGTPSATPEAPSEEEIRTAITADGASGVTAYFVVLGTVTVGAGVTDITEDVIEQGTATGAGASFSPEEVFGVTETISITPESWAELEDSSPFTVSATITPSTTVTNDMLIELYNDQPVLFANYGFALARMTSPSQTLTVYALSAPEEAVQLTINFKEV